MEHTLYTYYGMPCWAEATSNSDKIKPATLAIIKLRLSEKQSSQQKIPLNN